jgi:hypothetical protein
MVIFGLAMVMYSETTPNDNLWGLLGGLVLPNAHVAVGNTQTVGTIDAWDIMKIIWNIGGMALLYFPVLFQGVYIWFWYCICLPIALGFWVAVGSILRGVSST